MVKSVCVYLKTICALYRIKLSNIGRASGCGEGWVQNGWVIIFKIIKEALLSSPTNNEKWHNLYIISTRRFQDEEVNQRRGGNLNLIKQNS